MQTPVAEQQQSPALRRVEAPGSAKAPVLYGAGFAKILSHQNFNPG